jgi:vesicle transport protein SEC22
MSIQTGDKVFYYMTRESLCFLTLAESRYPKRLAFLYLEEVGDLILGELLREYGNNVSHIKEWIESDCLFGSCFD